MREGGDPVFSGCLSQAQTASVLSCWLFLLGPEAAQKGPHLFLDLWLALSVFVGPKQLRTVPRPNLLLDLRFAFLVFRGPTIWLPDGSKSRVVGWGQEEGLFSLGDRKRVLANIRSDATIKRSDKHGGKPRKR